MSCLHTCHDQRKNGKNSLPDDLLKSMLTALPPFNGTDPNVSTDWCCKQCYKSNAEDGIHLLRCGRCQVVYYCTRSCQRKDFKNHKEDCQQIAQYNTEMNVEEQKLRQIQLLVSHTEDAFETSAGHFWGIIETRDYCRARHNLADVIEHVAHWYEVSPLINIALNHRLELLRLCASDTLGNRDRVPFTFLRANQDDRCFAFIKYWAKFSADMDSGSYNDTEIDNLHQNSSTGDWLYGSADKCEDLLETVSNLPGDSISLAHYAALCIIKLRIFEAHEERKRQIKALSNTVSGEKLGDGLQIVEKYFLGDKNQQKRYEQQEEMVNKYFDIMDRKNPTLMKAVINPGPLKSQPAPAYISFGTASEAWGILMDCNRLFIRIPNVESRLRKRYGACPTYDCTISTGF